MVSKSLSANAAPARQKVARISWTPTEDKIIVSEVQKRGFRWTQIANQLQNRTDDAVRNRWHRIQKHAAIHNHAIVTAAPAVKTRVNESGSASPAPFSAALLHKEKLSIAG